MSCIFEIIVENDVDARYAVMKCPYIDGAGIRVVPRVITRPFWDEFFFMLERVGKSERKKSDERKITEHQRRSIEGN